MGPKKQTPDKACNKAKANRNTKATAAATKYTFNMGPNNISWNLDEKAITLRVKINGTPRPMYRTQAVNRKGKMTVFTPSKANKDSFSKAIKEAINKTKKVNPFNPGSGHPVSITANFHLRRPNSHFNIMGLLPTAPKYCTKNPDIDNLLKLVMDALHGIVYENDSVVCDITARKFWLHKDTGHPWKDDFQKEECTIIKITEHLSNSID
jgi:Holliday junction resolvase RusA-like endonuclease